MSCDWWTAGHVTTMLISDWPLGRSLLALGNCINALAEKKTKFVNYRDSKLTRWGIETWPVASVG